MALGGLRWWTIALFGLAWSSMAAQGTVEAPPPSPPTPAATGYAVTGRVVCGDTQRAARFAQVTLIPASEGDGEFEGGRGRPATARTDLDGNFSIAGVSAGDYFVTASLAGYINEAPEVQAVLRAGTDLGTALSGVPEVRVGAGGASAALMLQRGGVIAGTVQWDDGSPAGGVQVSAQPAPTTGAQSTAASQLPSPGGNRPAGFGGGFNVNPTDDRGHFRITGLPPGVYLVRAAIQAPAPGGGETRGFNRTLSLYVYAPDKMRRSDATAVTIAGAEEHADMAITMGLAGLHTVSGSISSPGAAVRSGTVNLTDQADTTLTRMGTIGPDGGFVVPYVPPGSYTMNVNASSQASASGRGGYAATATSGSTVRFQPLQESITVTDGDLTGLALNVTPASGTP